MQSNSDYVSRRYSTVDQLRHDIDSGKTGDKLAAKDPSAAPLGSDDEAAGTPAAIQIIEGAQRFRSDLQAAAKARPARDPNATATG